MKNLLPALGILLIAFGLVKVAIALILWREEKHNGRK